MQLFLGDNNLNGVLPTELGNLPQLMYLDLGNNPLSGPMPMSLTNLTALTFFRYTGTGLCAPADPAFQAWLRQILSLCGNGRTCGMSTLYFPVVLCRHR
jgi:hypothetical protein